MAAVGLCTAVVLTAVGLRMANGRKGADLIYTTEEGTSTTVIPARGIELVGPAGEDKSVLYPSSFDIDDIIVPHKLRSLSRQIDDEGEGYRSTWA